MVFLFFVYKCIDKNTDHVRIGINLYCEAWVGILNRSNILNLKILPDYTYLELICPEDFPLNIRDLLFDDFVDFI